MRDLAAVDAFIASIDDGDVRYGEDNLVRTRWGEVAVENDQCGDEVRIVSETALNSE